MQSYNHPGIEHLVHSLFIPVHPLLSFPVFSFTPSCYPLRCPALTVQSPSSHWQNSTHELVQPSALYAPSDDQRAAGIYPTQPHPWPAACKNLGQNCYSAAEHQSWPDAPTLSLTAPFVAVWRLLPFATSSPSTTTTTSAPETASATQTPDQLVAPDPAQTASTGHRSCFENSALSHINTITRGWFIFLPP